MLRILSENDNLKTFLNLRRCYTHLETDILPWLDQSTRADSPMSSSPIAKVQLPQDPEVDT